jgi:hypothetical protein
LIKIAPADPAEIDRLARLWHDVWHETHAPLVPAALVGLRTLAGFRDRLQAALPDVFLAGPSPRRPASTFSRATSCVISSCRKRRAARASLR